MTVDDVRRVEKPVTRACPAGRVGRRASPPAYWVGNSATFGERKLPDRVCARLVADARRASACHHRFRRRGEEDIPETALRPAWPAHPEHRLFGQVTSRPPTTLGTRNRRSFAGSLQRAQDAAEDCALTQRGFVSERSQPTPLAVAPAPKSRAPLAPSRAPDRRAVDEANSKGEAFAGSPPNPWRLQ